MNVFNNPAIKPGYLEVYTGPMKSGKTKRILNRIDKLRYIDGCKYIFIKPKIDTRNEGIVSRFGTSNNKCFLIDEKNPLNILDVIGDEIHMIIIDEAHFFSEGLIDVIEKLLSMDINVVVAGLDMDFRGVPFGIMPQILSLANKIYKLTGVCEVEGCYAPATRSQRLIDGNPADYNSPIILIGDVKEGYQCRCYKHHIVRGKAKND